MTATIAKLRSTVAFQMALDRQRLATQVVAHRDRQHFTQRDLEAKSGVSLRTIQRVENPGDVEEVRYSTIERLAKGLGVKPEDLTGDAIEHVPPGEIGSGETPDVMGSLNGDKTQLDRIEAAIDEMRKDQRKLTADLRVVLLEEFERSRAAMELPTPGQAPASDAPPRRSNRAKGRRATG